jgi:hypothetical protein
MMHMMNACFFIFVNLGYYTLEFAMARGGELGASPENLLQAFLRLLLRG